jgi:hypothetical protein
MSSNKSRPRARRSNDRVDGAGAGGDGGRPPRSLRVAIQARKTATIAGSAGNVIADREAHQAANSRQSLDRRDGRRRPARRLSHRRRPRGALGTEASMRPRHRCRG